MKYFFTELCAILNLQGCKRELPIYIDLVVYNTSLLTDDRNKGAIEIDTEYRKFLKEYFLNMSKTPFSIISLVKKLCIDIKELLHNMREATPIRPSVVIDKLKFNMKVLEYCKAIFEKTPILYIQNYLEEYKKRPKVRVCKPTLSSSASACAHKPTEADAEADAVARHSSSRSSSTSPTEVYNVRRMAFEKVNYKKEDRLMKKLIKGLLLYDLTSVLGDEDKNEEDTYYELIVNHINIYQSDTSNVFDTLISIYRKMIKLYSDYKSHSRAMYKYIRDPPYKNKSSESPPIQMRKDYLENPLYINEIDPYTQESFNDMSEKRRKYASDIVYISEGKQIQYRFDTVSIYNHLLKCIDTCEKPTYIYNKDELTDENLYEICTKIKYFTKNLTYTSSEIRRLLKDCIKYNNLLKFDFEIVKDPHQPDKDIQKIYLNVKLGEILFRVFQNSVLSLPSPEHKETILLLEILNQRLKDGALIRSKYFPYQKNNTILKLPKFDINLKEDTVRTLEKLKAYKQKILQI